MAKKMYVVFCEDDGTYWCGLNTWDKQLRKAKVFHSLKYANEVAERYKWLKLRNVEIRMEIVPEHPSNADRFHSATNDALKEEIHAISLGFKPWCDHHCANEGDDGCDNCIGEWLQQPAEEVKNA